MKNGTCKATGPRSRQKGHDQATSIVNILEYINICYIIIYIYAYNLHTFYTCIVISMYTVRMVEG